MAAFMPFIPKGQINVYRFVPLDETYQNTLHFETRAQQLAYFGCNDESTGYEDLLTPRANSIDKVKLVGQSFTRNERQYVRIEGNACNFYDCNYMAYQNRDFGQMWFFAFVHEVIYVNDYCTELQFEIDVMQTFMWNYELRECFVEREHTLTDKLYEHLQPEPLPQFPFVNTNIEKSEYFDEWSIIMGTTYDPNGDVTKPVMTIYDRIPVGGMLTRYDFPADISTLETALQNLAQLHALDGIYAMFFFPTALSSGSTTTTFIHRMESPTDIDGYEPVNNRLFAFPFSYIDVDSNTTEGVFKFELFDTNEPTFKLDPCVAGIPTIKCTPLNYDSKSVPITTDYNKCIVMTNFPQMQTSSDNFAAWWGTNSWTELGKLAIGTGELVYGVAQGNPNVGSAGITTLASAGADFYSAAHTPATIKIPQGVYSDISDGTMNFYFKTVQICAEGARVVDDYFTMYGYNVNKVKVPNVRNYNTCRKHFNYIKCREMSFHWELFMSEGKGTSVPQYYMKKIISIYQNGITFWKNPNKVGRYDELKYSNRP